MHWFLLAIAISAEVIATSSLKLTEGFSRLWPSLAVIAGYALAFYFLSLTLRYMTVGVAYAIWAGTGIALIALIGWVVFGERLDWAGMLGITLIIAGVVILNAFSRTITA